MTYMGLIGGVASISTLGALIYQFGYLLEVCELCWWQRIFMFPLEFIALWSVFRGIRGNHGSILGLAAFGIFFAGYHYYLHFQSWILKNDVVELGLTSCNTGGILPSCTDPAGVVIWGFLTIPLMALIAFIAIFWLAFLASRTRDMAS